MKKITYLLCSVLFLCIFFACGKENTKEKVDAEKGNAVEQEMQTVHVKEGTGNIIQYQTDFGNTIIVQFSKKINESGDLSSKITLSPELPFDAVVIEEDKILLTGEFNSEFVYQADFSKLTDNKRDVLSIRFRQKPAYLAFEHSGILLPNEDKTLSIKMVNLEKATISVYKIFSNNANTFVNSLSFSEGGNYYYTFEERLEEMGELVFQETHTIPFQKNKNSYLKVNLNNVLSKNGIYAIRLDGQGAGDGYNSLTIRKALILSNVGMLVQKLPESIKAQLVEIQSRKVLPGVKVFLMSKNNQILAQEISNQEGKVTFLHPSQDAYYLKTIHGSDINVLKLRNQLPMESFDISGVGNFESNQIYVYTDRPEYRPGEEIHANIVVRNHGKTLPEGHPVLVSWIDPTGKSEEKKLAWNKNSFYALSKSIPKKAMTGVWGLSVRVGDSYEYLEIPVETNLAKKLESKLTVPKKEKAEVGKAYKISLESKYLYGDPSPDQEVQVIGRIAYDKKRFLNYENYRFDLPRTIPMSEKTFKLSLKNGKGALEVPFFEKEEEISNSWNMNVYWEAQVLDENSRPNPTYAVTNLEKYSTFVGIEDYEGQYFTPGEEKKVPVVVLDSNGRRVEGHRLQYTIYQKSSLFWYDFYEEDEYLSLKNDKSAKKIKEGQITTSASKNSYISIPGLEEGSVYIEVEDLQTHQMTGTSYRLNYWGEDQKFQHISKLRMNSNKKTYKVGDIASVYWEAAEDAKAFISFQKDGKIMKSFSLDVNEKTGRIDIPITKEMVPNIYVNVVLLQDYEKYDNDRPARLYGILPIVVEDDEHDVGIKIDVPKEVQSKETLSVKISNQKQKQMDYVVSVIDLGLLQKPNYKAPNPHSYFFAKRAYLGFLYDNYDILLPKNKRREDVIMTVGGGDYEEEDNLAMAKAVLENKALGIEEADRFQNLALYRGIIRSDEKGNLDLSFDLPRYQGAVKVIVTGVEQEFYGAASDKVLVKAPVIMQNSAPRVLKVGDSFHVSTRLVQKDPKITKGKWRVIFAGKVKEKVVDFSKEKNIFLEEKFESPKKIGIEEIKISFIADSYQDEESIFIDVNTTNSYTYLDDTKELKVGGKYKTTLPKDIVSGSDSMKIAISTSKRYGIDRTLQSLIRYPYGCAEQVTSIAMAQLYLKNLETVSLLPEVKIQENINASISKLREYQTNSGFSYWPNGYVSSPFSWLDNYIGEFILRAKAQGYYVNDSFYDYVIDLLQKKSLQNDDIPDKVYALWILADIQKANISELNYLRESMYRNLSLTAKWLLLSTYAKQGEVDFAKSKAKMLTIWDKNEDARELALRVEAYRTIFGNIKAEDEQKLLALLGETNSYDTYSIARILMALVQKQTISKEAEFSVDGKTEKTKYGIYHQNYPKGKEITITNTGNSNLYVYYFWEGKTLDTRQKAEEKGIHLQRSSVPKKVKSGEIIEWKVTIGKSKKSSVEFLEKVAMTEILPSGWEWEVHREDFEHLPLEYIDIRDDRILFIFSDIGDTPIEIPFKARAITKGKYTFPGSIAEQMYHSEIRGNLENQAVEVGL